MKLTTSLVSLSSLTLVALSFACGGAQPAASSASSTQGSAVTEPAPDPNANLPRAANAGQKLGQPLLDDMEDGDNKIIEADGRGGYWYTYKDDSSTIAPEGNFTMAQGGADNSKFAARFSGTIGSAQYPFAGMGFSFFDPKGAYDISSCKGISFKAKKNTPESNGMMRLKVGDVNTVPEGGVCKSCFNDFGRDVLLTEQWTEIRAPFFEMRQEPYWGEPKPAIDASRVFQLQWQVKEPGAFDISVDDVKLIDCAAAG
jgi:endoglucanase